MPADQRLKQIECFLMDMDGTIYLGNRLLPGAQTWMNTLRDFNLDYYFLTNNSSSSQLEYARKLQRLGLSVSAEQIFTSGEATAIYLKAHYPDQRLYVVGTPSLVDEFRRHDLCLVDEEPDVAVLGFDTTLTYEKLWKLSDLVVAGKPFIATHPDINCPTETGYKPDIGAMLALIEASTGRQPDVIVGKPNKPIVDALVEKTGFPASAHCMIGDRLYTDIALGQWGMVTSLVLSGETRREDLTGASFQPDFVVQDIAEMADMLKKAYA